MLRDASDRLNFEYLVQAVPQAAAIVRAEDPDYPIVAANDAYLRALDDYDAFGKPGRDPGAHFDRPPVVGKSLFETLRHGTAARERLRSSVHDVVSSRRTHSLEYVDKQRLWSFTHYPLTDEEGAVSHVVLYAHRQDASDELSADAGEGGEGQLLRAFKHAATALAVFDSQGKVTACNEAFAATLGHSLRQLQSMEPASLIHPDDYAQRGQLVQRLFAGEIPAFVQEMRYLRNDGEDIWVCDSVSLLQDERGSARARKMVAITEDITRRKKAEKVLLQTEGLVTMGRLSASIAHELNNPLESVTNLLFLISNSVRSEETQYYAKLAEQELARVTKIATQTLRFYRPQSSPAPVDLADVMESVLALFEGRIRREQVNVSKAYGRNLPTLLAYSGELRQVFVNLVGNALDSMAEGGSIRISVRASRDWKLAGSEGVRVTVCDAGSGIAKAMLQKVFEPFVSTKEKSGTGLGLWISRNIVRRYGGTLHVRSAQTGSRHGTCMSVFLPVETARIDANAA